MAAGALDVPLEYVRLGLRFDRLESGFVDAYTGDPRLRRAGRGRARADAARAARPGPRPARASSTPPALPADRADYLRGQLTGLECTARQDGRRAGRVRRRGGGLLPGRRRPRRPGRTTPPRTPSSTALLPGGGPLAERYAAHRRREECPPDRLEAAVHALSSALRDRVRGRYGLPEVETVRLRGGHRPAVVGLQLLRGRLPVAGGDQRRPAAPAAASCRTWSRTSPIPGHHTEHCRKERGLVERAARTRAHGLPGQHARVPDGRGAGRPRRRRPRSATAGDRGRRRSSATWGSRFDGHLAERVAAAAAPLNRVPPGRRVLLHDRGAGPGRGDRVPAALVAGERRAGGPAVRFLTHPLWRAYISTYVEGYDLLSALAGGRPADQPVADRFLRLLDEPLTPRAVAAELRAA